MPTLSENLSPSSPVNTNANIFLYPTNADTDASFGIKQNSSNKSTYKKNNFLLMLKYGHLRNPMSQDAQRMGILEYLQQPP